jgi:iron complex transport system permease protein
MSLVPASDPRAIASGATAPGTTLAAPAAGVADRLRRAPLGLVLSVLTIGLAASMTLAVTIGPVAVPAANVWRVIGAHLVPAVDGLADGVPKSQANIVWLIRLPRVLLGAMVGGALAVVGVAMQATVRNPIAEPYLLGVTAGASLGAVLVILLGWFASAGQYALAGAAFVGGLASFALVLGLSRRNGQVNPLRLVLVGAAVAHMFGAATSFVTFVARNQDGIQNALFWMAGSVAGAKWGNLQVPAFVLGAGTLALLVQARPMNALVAGEETATTLGIDTGRVRAFLMTVSALVVGAIVAVAGAIGFVGLVVPHATRLVVGADHRRVLPVACLVGAIFLTWVDVGARMVVAPQELPIGVLTAALGGPFFLWLLRHRSRAIDGSAQ